MMNKIYLLIDYVESGSVIQIRSFRNLQNAIEEGKRSLEYDYDNGYFRKRYQEFFNEMPSLEELISQWENQCYRYGDYLEIMESEICD